MNSRDLNNIDFKDLDVDVSHTSIEKKEEERIDFIPPVSCSELVELSWKGKFEMDKIALVNETTAAVDDNKSWENLEEFHALTANCRCISF